MLVEEKEYFLLLDEDVDQSYYFTFQQQFLVPGVQCLYV